jgi:hypothetical protein
MKKTILLGLSVVMVLSGFKKDNNMRYPQKNKAG